MLFRLIRYYEGVQGRIKVYENCIKVSKIVQKCTKWLNGIAFSGAALKLKSSFLIFLDSTKLIIVWIKITTFFKPWNCAKSVQIRSYFWSVFSGMWTEYEEIRHLSLFSPNAGKYGPEITLYLDTFHAVHVSFILWSFSSWLISTNLVWFI